jgi:hypothetical protein
MTEDEYTLEHLEAVTRALMRAAPEYADEARDLVRQAWKSGFLIGCAAAANGLRAGARPPVRDAAAASLILTIESTSSIVELVTTHGEIPARVFDGVTESGIPVQCFIARIAVKRPEDVEAFAKELLACSPLRTQAFDTRLVL